VLTEIFTGLIAVGTFVTAAGVFFACSQLQAAKDQDRTHFEDDLSRQYRQIVGLLPAEAFYSNSDTELGEETHRAFYRYFDLSNEQLFLARQNHRVSDAVIEQWKDGITGNMELPAFRLAWREIGARVPSDFFEDLRELSGVEQVREPQEDVSGRA
jgi:hypothetical protein